MSPLLMLSFLVCVVSVSAEFEVDGDLILKQHQQVMQTILSTLQMQSPQRRVSNFDLSNRKLQSCFDSIKEKQAEDLAIYQDRLEGCRRGTSYSKELLSRQTNEKRNRLLKRGYNACDRLKECERVADGLQFFTCYSQAADMSSQDLRNVSLISSAEVDSLKIQYQQMDRTQKPCDSLAKNLYSIISAQTNKEMKGCLVENFVPPSGTNDRPSTVFSTVLSTASPIVSSKKQRIFLPFEKRNSTFRGEHPRY